MYGHLRNRAVVNQAMQSENQWLRAPDCERRNDDLATTRDGFVHDARELSIRVAQFAVQSVPRCDLHVCRHSPAQLAARDFWHVNHHLKDPVAAIIVCDWRDT